MTNPMFEAMDPYSDIDPKELEDNTEVDSAETKEIPGTENFFSKLEKQMVNKATDGVVVVNNAARQSFFIRCSPDGINFRVYFASYFYADARVISSLCRFLDSRTPDQVVTLCLGVDFDFGPGQSHLINPILSSITSCKAKVVGICMGMCGFSETMMWCYCHERKAMRYGALTFIRPTEVLKEIPELKDYYETFFDHAVNDLNVLSAEERERIMTKNDSIVKFSSTLQL